MNKYVGIDMAKADFWASFNETLKPKKFSNSDQGISTFLADLKKKTITNKKLFLAWNQPEDII